MEKFIIKTDSNFEIKFEKYPKEIREKLSYLRNLIIESAAEIESIFELSETLKWTEPSFVVKKGSTIRIDWKSKKPNQYAMYFQCTSKLVPTFKKVFGDKFKYEKSRAILFSLDEKIPTKELKECIKSALKYHLVKNEPMLGINLKEI